LFENEVSFSILKPETADQLHSVNVHVFFPAEALAFEDVDCFNLV